MVLIFNRFSEDYEPKQFEFQRNETKLDEK
jgi:hypothetical protein